jgi:amino acid transporter
MAQAGSDVNGNEGLDRALTLAPLILYGMGVIVGAGIYVALGAVMQRAGAAAPVSFFLAGVSASLTGLCYAELASRFPEASGAAGFVRRAFRSGIAGGIATLAITAATAVAAASIAHGAAVYWREIVAINPWLITSLVIAVNTGIAIYGVRTSVGLAAVVGAVEILGLAAAVAVGLHLAPDYRVEGLLPATTEGWLGVLDGAFIAYFAFIGFETLVNMAEEVKDPTRTVPAGVIGAIAASMALYVLVAISVILAERAGGNPLLGLFEGAGALAFSIIGSISIANGVLVEIVMLSRLFYGMSRAGLLPRAIGRVEPFTRTPVIATLAAGAIILVTALLAPFERLLTAANAIMLTIFLMVDVSLLLVKRRQPSPRPAFCVPGWVPPAAIVGTVILLLAGARG